jgi:hypothetical protein
MARRLKRVHILLPEDLAREIDAVAGRRGRSAFLVETAQEALRRRKLLEFLARPEPAWKEADHPDMGDSAAWVRKLRNESDQRSRARANQKTRRPRRP